MNDLIEETGFEVKNNILTTDNYNIFIAYSDRSFQVETALIYDAVIIEGGDLNFTLHILKKIRSHSNPEFYLKPIFLLKGGDSKDALINNLVDGIIYSLDQVKLMIPIMNKIYLKIADISYTKSLSFEAQLIDKVLNYMYSREKKQITPSPYMYSGIGYTFPEVSVNFDFKEEWQVLEILQIAEEEGLFTSEYVERVYLCGSCSNGYLMYREVCPQCDSTNSVSEDLVHHFPCAYIGPISDFQNELDSQLNCPKCNKSLRHIGVDYDKPAIIYTCKNCSGRFQDYNVKARCLACLQDKEVQYLICKEIKKYDLTKKGETAAVTGFISTSKDIEDFIGTVKAETFRTFVKYEIERLRQNDSVSSIGCIHIRNAGELYSRIGSNSQRALLKELVDVVRRNLRSSDIISFESATTLLVSIYDLPEKVADNMIGDITKIIGKLITKNFKNFVPDIRHKVQPLNTTLSHELQVQQLIKEFNV